ncbi:MAG: hypothetical protein K8F27_07035 [Sulfuricellaceae bacterium]|nr:hypothetical protein [Sulfuricellaceae bacterium]
MRIGAAQAEIHGADTITKVRNPNPANIRCGAKTSTSAKRRRAGLGLRIRLAATGAG